MGNGLLKQRRFFVIAGDAFFMGFGRRLFVGF
jgi:hypothetical protein